MSSSTDFILVPDEPVEKFNGMEQGAARRAEEPDQRRGRKRKARDHARTPTELQKNIRPTPERMAKDDVTSRIFEIPDDAEREMRRPGSAIGAVVYRAPPPIERMRDRGQLDPNPIINYAMFAAAEKLEALFYDSGLTHGVQAQDISRVVVHGGDAAGRYMAQGEKQAHCRQQFRLAVKLLGWHEAYPHRGAGRLVVDVVCYGMNVETAARRHMPPTRTASLMAAGMDRLREGLFGLACFWKMF